MIQDTLRPLRPFLATFAVKRFLVFSIEKKTLTAKNAENFREVRGEKPDLDGNPRKNQIDMASLVRLYPNY